MDHIAFVSQMAPVDRARLTRRSDGRGLLRLVLHLGLIGALMLAVGLKLPGWPLLVLPLGVCMAFLFTLQHECTHRTPFATPWLNEWVGHFCALILAQPFLWFRWFHLAHHKHTNIPGKDPELDGEKPADWPSLLWHVAALGYWRAKLQVLIRNAFGRIDAGYVPAPAKPRLRREARLLLAAYGLAALAALTVAPVLLRIWLLPLVLGFPVLRIYLLAEHGRCPQVANMFANTRTTFTNRVVRFLAWNMPYHAEHHIFPQVPFHSLPALHGLTRAHLQCTTRGYGRFAREYATAVGTGQMTLDTAQQPE